MRREAASTACFPASQLFFIHIIFVSDYGESSHLKLDSLAAAISMSHDIDPARSAPQSRFVRARFSAPA